MTESGLMATSGLFSGYGKAIAKIRAAANMSQAELGDAIGVGANMVSRYEREVADPGLEGLGKILVATRSNAIDFVYYLDAEKGYTIRHELRQLVDDEVEKQTAGYVKAIEDLAAIVGTERRRADAVRLELAALKAPQRDA